MQNPDEVELEYPTVDGKAVDYALKLNKKPVLLVEAKALDDALDDVKAVTQVVGYAANDGIVWCVLTNGIKWRVYGSMEKCPALDKRLLEVNLDPKQSEGMSVEQIARRMWLFSADEMARGTLDALGKQMFTDKKVRKALHALMTDPPRSFLNLLCKAARDESLTTRQIKESLSRIAGDADISESIKAFADLPSHVLVAGSHPSRSDAAKKAWATRRAKKGESPYDENHHLSGKPREVVSLYRAIDRLCLSFDPSAVSKRFLAKYVNYEYRNRCFCSVHVLQSGLRVWLSLKYNQIQNPPSFARDVANIGHWGIGDVELRISNNAELDEAANLVRRSFELAK